MNTIINLILVIIVAAVLFVLVGWVASQLPGVPLIIWTLVKILIVLFAVIEAIATIRGTGHITLWK